MNGDKVLPIKEITKSHVFLFLNCYLSSYLCGWEVQKIVILGGLGRRRVLDGWVAMKGTLDRVVVYDEHLVRIDV